jgi:hypothetical protein
MKNKKLKNLRELLNGLPDCESSLYKNSFLSRFLDSESLCGNSGNTETFKVGFALNRAKQRLNLVSESNTEAFGLHELIATLSSLDECEMIDFVYLEDDKYIGTCFVLGERVLGYECVLKKGCKTEKYDGV